MEKYTIDDLDKKILSIITSDARVSFLEIGKECGVSGAAVHQRVQRLTKLGIITGSEFTVCPKKTGLYTSSFIGIYLDKPTSSSSVVEKLKSFPEVTECYYTTGNYSLFVKLFTQDNEHLKELITERIHLLDGVSRTETILILEQSFRKPIPFV